MAQIILNIQGKDVVHVLNKKITNIGTLPSHDVLIASQQTGLLFSIVASEHGYDVIPSSNKIKKNGRDVYGKAKLEACDRIEWTLGSAVFLTASMLGLNKNSEENALQSLSILHNLANSLEIENSGSNLSTALQQSIRALVDLAGAEEGYLLSELGEDRAWQLIASVVTNEERLSSKALLSNTILDEAIKSRAPVYIENIIGHSMANAASVIAARIFSVACFPLIVSDRIFGAVFLYTRSPGKSIRKERLTELKILATQAALMLASCATIQKLKRENQDLKTNGTQTPSSFIYDQSVKTNPLFAIDQKLSKLAQTPLNILIQGETGTGKEIAARELHLRSSRKSQPFVAVNCAAIPATLLEATLFGYEKGAFTGAVRSQTGKFKQADGGTLFLDEIGDLPLELQAKLLRVLQENVVEPLGAIKAQKINVRVVSATHRNIPVLVSEKNFRQDLYFRLNGSTIQLSPLRERPYDIKLLAKYFLGKIYSNKEISTEAITLLQNYPWPGNVRELEQVIAGAAYLSEGNIETKDLDLNLIAEKELSSELFENYSNLNEAQLAFTKSFVQKHLAKNAGNRAETATQLGISERTLYRMLADTKITDSSVRVD